MANLTEESLIEAIKDIQSMIDKSDGKVTSEPTTIMYQPAMLDELGITHDDLLKILNGNKHEQNAKAKP